MLIKKSFIHAFMCTCMCVCDCVSCPGFNSMLQLKADQGYTRAEYGSFVQKDVTAHILKYNPPQYAHVRRTCTRTPCTSTVGKTVCVVQPTHCQSPHPSTDSLFLSCSLLLFLLPPTPPSTPSLPPSLPLSLPPSLTHSLPPTLPPTHLLQTEPR